MVLAGPRRPFGPFVVMGDTTGSTVTVVIVASGNASDG